MTSPIDVLRKARIHVRHVVDIHHLAQWRIDRRYQANFGEQRGPYLEVEIIRAIINAALDLDIVKMADDPETATLCAVVSCFDCGDGIAIGPKVCSACSNARER